MQVHVLPEVIRVEVGVDIDDMVRQAGLLLVVQVRVIVALLEVLVELLLRLRRVAAHLVTQRQSPLLSYGILIEDLGPVPVELAAGTGSFLLQVDLFLGCRHSLKTLVLVRLEVVRRRLVRGHSRTAEVERKVLPTERYRLRRNNRVSGRRR